MDSEIEFAEDLQLSLLACQSDAEALSKRIGTLIEDDRLHRWAKLSVEYAGKPTLVQALKDARGAVSEVECHLRAARHNNGETLVREVATAD